MVADVNRLLAELKRRKVIRVAGLYLVTAWLLVQVAETLLPMFGAPEWVARSLVVLLALGFVPALVFTWVFERTAGGLRRDDGSEADPAASAAGNRRLDIATLVVAVLAIGLLAGDRIWPRPEARSESLAPAAPAPDALAASAADVPEALAAAGGRSDKVSIAVLPFVNMSSDPEQEYFSDGLSEELLNQLAHLPQLRVIARTSSFSFKGKDVDVATIAEALDVGHVLEGSVRRAGDRLRITAQLIRTADSSHLWSQTYDRTVDDVFAVQDEIAGEVVAALKLELLPDQSVAAEKPTRNLEAYHLFLQARAQRKQGNTDAYRKAIATFRQAIALDPAFARAWAGLANTQAFLADSTADLDLHRVALASINRAVELAPDDPEVLADRGTILALFAWDWEGARRDAERALRLDPNNVSALGGMAWNLATNGRVEEAQDYADRAYALDPLSFGGAFTRGLIYNSLGRAAEAVPVMDLILADQPDNSMARILRNTSLVMMGEPERALAEPGAPGTFAAQFTLALAGKSVGREAEAMAALAQLEAESAMGAAYQIAELHAWHGDTDQAFAWLDRALKQRDGGMAMLGYDPLLRPLHGDPRFAALKVEMGFSE